MVSFTITLDRVLDVSESAKLAGKVQARVSWAQLQIDSTGKRILLTDPVYWDIVNGVGIVKSEATPTGNALCITINAGLSRYEWFVLLSDSDDNKDLSELQFVDPDTLDPMEPPSPAWVADVDRIDSELALKVSSDDVNGLVDDALDTYVPGTELAYAEIHSASPYTPYSNTQTSVASTASNVTGLTITFTGTGRPVIITLAIGIIWHSIANTKVSVGLAVNGVIATAPGMIGSVYAGAAGSAGGVSPPVLRRRINTVAGQTYTVDARVSGAVAGTTSVGITNTPYVPSSLQALAC